MIHKTINSAFWKKSKQSLKIFFALRILLELTPDNSSLDALSATWAKSPLLIQN